MAMICTAELPYNKPRDRFAGKLPFRVWLKLWPHFITHCESENDRPSTDPLLCIPTQEFLDWVISFAIGPYEIYFWNDIIEASHCAANDIEYPDAWSVGFANEKDAVFFKMRWL
jgi:hypothetical protein